MKKLSKAQTELIKYLRDGGIIYWMDGINGCCFRDNMRTISWATIFVLEKLNLVERSNPIGRKIILTELGKTIEL